MFSLFYRKKRQGSPLLLLLLLFTTSIQHYDTHKIRQDEVIKDINIRNKKNCICRCYNCLPRKSSGIYIYKKKGRKDTGSNK